jgi:hypothetical protein
VRFFLCGQKTKLGNFIGTKNIFNPYFYDAASLWQFVSVTIMALYVVFGPFLLNIGQK